MKRITRTVYGARLQTSHLLGLPYTHIPNTTLNEKFDVQSGVLPANGDLPTTLYYAVGKGGHRVETGADGKPYISPIQHLARDAALYEHVPFIVRDLDDDLDVITRQKYAMRKIITVGGQQYIAYYLKRLDLSTATADLLNNEVVDGVVNSVPFVPTGANLNPEPPAIPSTGSVTTSGTYLSTSSVVRLDFTAQDVAEYVNVARLLYNNELMAVISEVGLVAAVDKTVTAPAYGGGQFNYREALVATITAHITAYYSVGFTNMGFDFGLQLGATEPLLDVAPGT